MNFSLLASVLIIRLFTLSSATAADADSLIPPRAASGFFAERGCLSLLASVQGFLDPVAGIPGSGVLMDRNKANGSYWIYKAPEFKGYLVVMSFGSVGFVPETPHTQESIPVTTILEFPGRFGRSYALFKDGSPVGTVADPDQKTVYADIQKVDLAVKGAKEARALELFHEDLKSRLARLAEYYLHNQHKTPSRRVGEMLYSGEAVLRADVLRALRSCRSPEISKDIRELAEAQQAKLPPITESELSLARGRRMISGTQDKLGPPLSIISEEYERQSSKEASKATSAP